MYLMYTLNETGKREYTLKKVHPEGRPVFSAHPGKCFERRLRIVRAFNWGHLYTC